MSSLIDYNGLKVVSPDPDPTTAAGGNALNTNFRTIGDNLFITDLVGNYLVGTYNSTTSTSSYTVTFPAMDADNHVVCHDKKMILSAASVTFTYNASTPYAYPLIQEDGTFRVIYSDINYYNSEIVLPTLPGLDGDFFLGCYTLTGSGVAGKFWVSSVQTILFFRGAGIYASKATSSPTFLLADGSGGTLLNANQFLAFATFSANNGDYPPAQDAVRITPIAQTAASGEVTGLGIHTTYNTSGTAGSVDILVDRTNTSLGSGNNYLADFRTVGATKFNITSAGQIGIGIASPATSAAVDITSTTGALLLSRMTTTQKNALTAVEGMLVYDTTLGKLQGYQAGSWQDLI